MDQNRPRAVIILGKVLLGWGIVLFIIKITEFLYLSHNFPFSKFILPMSFQLMYCAILTNTGLGLANLKSWGRIAALFIVVPILVIIQPYIEFEYLRHFKGNVFSNFNLKLVLFYTMLIIRPIFGIMLLYFLTRPGIKEQFKEKNEIIR